jgi:hypothetical protein
MKVRLRIALQNNLIFLESDFGIILAFLFDFINLCSFSSNDIPVNHFRNVQFDAEVKLVFIFCKFIH